MLEEKKEIEKCFEREHLDFLEISQIDSSPIYNVYLSIPEDFDCFTGTSFNELKESIINSIEKNKKLKLIWSSDESCNLKDGSNTELSFQFVIAWVHKFIEKRLIELEKRHKFSWEKENGRIIFVLNPDTHKKANDFYDDLVNITEEYKCLRILKERKVTFDKHGNIEEIIIYVEY